MPANHVCILALGNILAFVFYSAQTPQPRLIGDILNFIGFLMYTIGFLSSGRR